MAQVQKHSDLDSYLESIYVRSHSLNTVNNYRIGVGNFQKFVVERFSCTDIELVNKIKKSEHDVYKILRDFVIYLDEQKYRATSIKLKLAAVKGYLRYLDLKIYAEDFNQVIKMPRKVVVREEAVTKEMIIRLLRNSPPKLQSAILVATSSGMRVGELVQIRISDEILDVSLLYKVMNRIHFAYFNAIALGNSSVETNKLPPHSKEWREHIRWNKPASYPYNGFMTGHEIEEYVKKSKKK